MSATSLQPLLDFSHRGLLVPSRKDARASISSDDKISCLYLILKSAGRLLRLISRTANFMLPYLSASSWTLDPGETRTYGRYTVDNTRVLVSPCYLYSIGCLDDPRRSRPV